MKKAIIGGIAAIAIGLIGAPVGLENTVGVSAVRDLYGTLQNEGASKGILVTTSGYGSASFDFAQNKPIERAGQTQTHNLRIDHGCPTPQPVTRMRQDRLNRILLESHCGARVLISGWIGQLAALFRPDDRPCVAANPGPAAPPSDVICD